MIKKLNKPGRYNLLGHTTTPEHYNLPIKTSHNSLMNESIGAVCTPKETL